MQQAGIKCRKESIRDVSSQFPAIWSGKPILFERSEFIGCSVMSRGIAEMARQLECRRLVPA